MDEAAARIRFEEALESYEQAFGHFFLARLVGLEIAYPDDICVAEFDIEDFMFNPQGVLHGGVIAFALDVSMGHLIHHVTGGPGMTLEMKTQYLRPIRAGRARCEGRFLKQGRRVSFMEARLTDNQGKLAAMATATWHMPEPQGGRLPLP